MTPYLRCILHILEFEKYFKSCRQRTTALNAVQFLLQNVQFKIPKPLNINFFSLSLSMFSDQKLKKTVLIVKPVYNHKPGDPKIVAVFDRWSLFRGQLKLYLGNGGRYGQVVTIRSWSLTQV